MSCMLNGKRVPIQRHKLVFECMSGELINSRIYDIDHIDGDATNDAFENLQLLTRAEHATKTAKTRSKTKSNTKPLIRYRLDENGSRVDIKMYNSLREAVKDIGGTPSNVSKAATQGVIRYGYRWEYMPDPDLEGEVWCSLRDARFEGINVSNLGRVRNKTGNRSYGHKSKAGYHTIGIGGKVHKVHRLVCMAFHGAPPSDMHVTVDHIDKDRGNNRASNLRWASTQEHNFFKSAIAVAAYNDEGVEVGRWASVTEAAHAINGYTTCISKCILGKLGSHRGLQWQRAS